MINQKFSSWLHCDPGWSDKAKSKPAGGFESLHKTGRGIGMMNLQGKENKQRAGSTVASSPKFQTILNYNQPRILQPLAEEEQCTSHISPLTLEMWYGKYRCIVLSLNDCAAFSIKTTTLLTLTSRYSSGCSSGCFGRAHSPQPHRN